MLPTVSMGASPRLEAVLRSGHKNRVKAMYTGAPGDSKLRKAGQAVLATTKPPALMSSKTSPVVMYEDGITTVAGPDMTLTTSKTNPMVEDLVSDYKQKTQDRREQLARARKNAEECADRRRSAVSEYQQEQEAAADAAIKQLQAELAEKEAMIDDMQNRSDEALAELQTAKDSGSATTAEVERLMALISQLSVEKTSVEDELAAKVKSCDEERDVAAREAEASIAATESEWEKKLAAGQAEAAERVLVLTTERDECNDKLAKALYDLEAETKAHNILEKLKEEEEDKFHDAAQAACAALKDYQDFKDERERKKMLNFVTNAPAGL